MTKDNHNLTKRQHVIITKLHKNMKHDKSHVSHLSQMTLNVTMADDRLYYLHRCVKILSYRSSVCPISRDET